jgi:lysozyme family protein
VNFDAAFERLIGHEGGYVNHKADPGGETKYGITKRTYPGENIRGMTLARAKEIYRRDFWGPAGCDAVPDAIKFDLFDAAVNSGCRQAVKFLQGAVGTVQDGLLGPKTLQALNATPPERLVMRFNALRLLFMAELTTWPSFGRGWARRVAHNLLST